MLEHKYRKSKLVPAAKFFLLFPLFCIHLPTSNTKQKEKKKKRRITGGKERRRRKTIVTTTFNRKIVQTLIS
jgi:hypothetical protein